jgi:hypothetical protein
MVTFKGEPRKNPPLDAHALDLDGESRGTSQTSTHTHLGPQERSLRLLLLALLPNWATA